MAEWHMICEFDDVGEEDVAEYHVHDIAIAVYKSPKGKIYATDAHCTHEQVSLCDGLVVDHTIECPKHNGRFDYTTGMATGLPCITALKTYPTKIEGSKIFVQLQM
jgi:3-phenylpropionate/trans-cinnamate dioxygenase ferredoxin component